MSESAVTSNPIVMVAETADTDIYVISGPIERNMARRLVNRYGRSQRRTNCALILTTFGGDADAAFIMARHLKRHYEAFNLYIFGMCKSAGTLLALGADEIIMSHHGEFGPLDVQMVKNDDFVRYDSGVDIFQALNVINEQAFSAFERAFLGIIQRSGGLITTRTAADIATKLATGLLGPIAEQIDPYRLSEVQRAISIAMEYGVRLGAKEETISGLIHSYPSHGFVIDFDEATELFPNVRPPTPLEEAMVQLVRRFLRDGTGQECIFVPHPVGVVECLTQRQEQQNEDSHEEADDQSPTNTESAPEADAEAVGGGSSDDRNGESPTGENPSSRVRRKPPQQGETTEAA